MQTQYRINEYGKVYLNNKINNAIELLKMYEPKEGYYVAFSGGKDSIVILDLVKKAGVKYEAFYHYTSVDPPELINYIRENYKEIKFTRPEKTMFQLIKTKLTPPTRIRRYCCEYLKENGGDGRYVVTGIRWEESIRRRSRRVMEACFKKSRDIMFFNIIIDWVKEEIWQYIRENNIKYCTLYDEGFERLGCVMCPMQSKKNYKRDTKRWPKIYNAYMLAFKVMLENRVKEGKKIGNWKKPEDVLDYIMETNIKVDENQMNVFD